MGAPTRFPAGVSTAPSAQILGNFRDPNPVNIHVFETDFDTYAAGDWTVTSGGGATALVAGDGGIVRLTTIAGISDIQGITKLPAAFKFTPGCQMWFACLWSQNSNALGAFFAGLMTGGTPAAPTDGVYFSKAAGAAINFNIKTGGSTTTLAAVSPAPTDNIPLALGFYYDGNPTTPRIHVFSSTGMTLPTYLTNTNANTGGREVIATTNMANLPASILAPVVAVQASTAAIRTADVDYLLAGNEILRF